MIMKSKKGYSLIEVAVGILILTVFLICSAALFNGAYNTYRMIQQRNLAINLAVKNMEELLQTDSNVLTGFFEEQNIDGKYSLVPNNDFMIYVKDNFDFEFKERYAKLNDISEDDVGTISDEEYELYIYEDSEYVINSYISQISEDVLDSLDAQDGNYGFLKENVNETGNLALINPGAVSEEDLSNYVGETMGVRTTILRLPTVDGIAFGNNVLKLKVEVFYTNKIDLTNLTSADVKTITLESVKVAE